MENEELQTPAQLENTDQEINETPAVAEETQEVLPDDGPDGSQEELPAEKEGTGGGGGVDETPAVAEPEKHLNVAGEK